VTKEEKKAYEEDLAKWNAARYKNNKAMWEIENEIQQLQATSTMPS
jgi:hypothetical protein